MKITLFIVVIWLITLIIACDDTLTNSNIDSVQIPSKNVSYSQYIQPIFNSRCTNTNCHDSFSRKAGLDLTTWAGATADPNIISRGSPENSLLVWTIDPQYGYVNPMPPPYGPVLPLTENQIEGIKTWIREGAEAN